MPQGNSWDRVAICKYHAANNRLTNGFRLSQLTQYPIHHRMTTRSQLNPYAFTDSYVLHTYIPYRNWIQVNILYWLVGHLYTTCTIRDYWRHISTKSSCLIYFDTWKNSLDFTDYIVRNDNSSVYEQELYGPYKRSKLQTKLIDRWSTLYLPAFYG